MKYVLSAVSCQRRKQLRGRLGQPVEQAIGELVTCSRCVGTWAAAGLATTQVLTPRYGRILTRTLGAAGINDFLQAGFAALTEKANKLEDRSD